MNIKQENSTPFKFVEMQHSEWKNLFMSSTSRLQYYISIDSINPKMYLFMYFVHLGMDREA